MKKSQPFHKLITVSSFAILLSMTTVILGAPFLRTLRSFYGPKIYWSFGFVVSGVAWLLSAQPLAIFISSVWMTLGVYTEFERKGMGWWSAGLTGVSAGAVTAALGIGGGFGMHGINTIDELNRLVEQFVQQVQTMNPAVKLDPSVLVQQIPSGVIVILIIALAMGLIFERNVSSWLNLPHEKVSSQLKLLEYRVPDYFIWVAMIAFLLTMVSFGGKAIAILGVNIVNVAIVLYFFQGLAVLEVFLRFMKAGVLMRSLSYLILVGQMMLLLSVVGLMDYWIDFRRRIHKMKAAENN